MPDGTTAITRPEHSPLGGSSAERWIECPGSVALADQIKLLGIEDTDEPIYRVEGTKGHSLGEVCLTAGADCWEKLDDFPDLSTEVSNAVQDYLNYVRSRSSSRMLVEHAIEHPAFHHAMYGRLDCVLFDPEPGIALEMIDLKLGAGVAVDAIGNAQERYYLFALAYGQKWPADLLRLQDMDRVKLTIVQPRGFHPAGTIRSEVVTVGEIVNWAYNTLRPAMQKAGEHNFKMGEHCRFCPGKLICPAMRHLATDGELARNQFIDAKDGSMLPDASDEWLAGMYARKPQAIMFWKAIEDEAKRRALMGVQRPEWKLVQQKVDRIYKEGAGDAAELLFGAAIYTEPKLLSPAGMEAKFGKATVKEFLAEWAMQPDAGLTIAPASDKRSAQEQKSNAEVFAGVEIPDKLRA